MGNKILVLDTVTRILFIGKEEDIMRRTEGNRDIIRLAKDVDTIIFA